MNVQKKIVCMLVVISVLFFCSVLGIRYYLLYNNLSLFESRATEKVDHFDQMLQFQQTTLEMFTYDAAVNRAIITFTRDRSLPELQKTLEDSMPSLGVDVVWLYSRDNQLLHYQCRLPGHEKSQPCLLDTDALKRMFQRGSYYRQFFKKLPLGIMEIQTGPATLHTHDEPEDQSPAIIIAGRLWSNAYINIIAKKSGAILQLLPLQGTENFEPAYDPATGRLNFARILFNEDRRPLGVLDISYETPLIEAFNRSSNMQILLMLIFGLVIVAVLAWSFSTWIITPLKKISLALQKSDPVHVQAITDHRNEFGTIALLIKNFFRQKDSLHAEIKERQEVEQALRLSQIRFQTLVETTSDLIWEIDADLTFTYASPRSRAMFGINPDELIGKSILDILLPEKPLSDADTPADTLKHHQGFNSLIACVHHKDERTLFVETSALPMYNNKNGQFLGYRGITRDITERRHIQEQLRQAQTMEAIGALAGGIAHDFNNILAAIIGYSEIAMNRLTNPTEVRSHLQSILKATDRAVALVKQILTFSRKTEQEKKPVKPKIIIKEAIELLRSTIPSTIEIQQHIQSDSVVLADPTQIHQVILNLCTNAGYAMQEKGGILKISLADVELDSGTAKKLRGLTAGNYLKLLIADTGRGIPSDIIERIFDPFFTTKPQGEGTGLGLSVAHGIIESCDGTISVSSKPDVGTTFEIYLPSIQLEIKVDTLSPEPIAHGMQSILFVDDEPMLVDIGTKALTSLGYRVTGCTGSPEALEVFKKDPAAFDAVITDYTMPQINGIDLAQEIISIKPHIPVILCTGGTDDINSRAQAVGIDEYVLKPLRIDELAKILHRVFNKQSA